MNNLFLKAFAFIRRDFSIEASYRMSFTLNILHILFRIPVFFFLSQFIDSISGSQVISGNYGYFAFVLIGTGMSDYFSGILNSFSGALRDSQQEGTLESLAASRTPLSAAVLFSGLYPALFSLVQLAIYFFACILISGITISQINLTGLAVSLTAATLCFFGLGLLSSIFVLLFKRGNPLNWILSNISWLLSGILYPTEILPEWLNRLSMLLPLTHAVKAVRRTLLEGASVSNVTPEIVSLFIIFIISYPFSVVLYKIAVDKNKKNNGFSHY